MKKFFIFNKSTFSEINFKILILKALENRRIDIKEKIEIDSFENLSRL